MGSYHLAQDDPIWQLGNGYVLNVWRRMGNPKFHQRAQAVAM